MIAHFTERIRNQHKKLAQKTYIKLILIFFLKIVYFDRGNYVEISKIHVSHPSLAPEDLKFYQTQHISIPFER